MSRRIVKELGLNEELREKVKEAWVSWGKVFNLDPNQSLVFMDMALQNQESSLPPGCAFMRENGEIVVSTKKARVLQGIVSGNGNPPTVLIGERSPSLRTMLEETGEETQFQEILGSFHELQITYNEIRDWDGNTIAEIGEDNLWYAPGRSPFSDIIFSNEE